jgi:hypothetical protein
MELSELKLADLFSLGKSSTNQKTKLDCQSLVSAHPDAKPYYLFWLSKKGLTGVIKFTAQERLVEDANADPDHLVTVVKYGESEKIALKAVQNLINNPKTKLEHLFDTAWGVKAYYQAYIISTIAYCNHLDATPDRLLHLSHYNFFNKETMIIAQNALIAHPDSKINHLMYLCEHGVTIEICVQAANLLLSNDEISLSWVRILKRFGVIEARNIAKQALDTDYYRAISSANFE